MFPDLGQLCHKPELKVCGRYCADVGGHGEWLWDMVWIRLRNGDWDHMVDIPLILESEWSVIPWQRDMDFQKLLAGRARHRVMVFQNELPERIDAIVARWVEWVRNYALTQPGDRYLFIGFDHADQKFHPSLFVA